MQDDTLCTGSLQWEGMKKSGAYPHLIRWYEHMSSISELRAIAEEYYPKRNNMAKKKVAEAIKEAKSNKETANTRHTGKMHCLNQLDMSSLLT